MAKRFSRKSEDFKCDNCGYSVLGSGYTNHCPNCLWSRHVDENPGDRAEVCRGLMEPKGVEVHGTQYIIVHRCVFCGETSRNKASAGDNFEVILELSSRPLAS